MIPLELQRELNLFLKEKVAKEIKVKFVNKNGEKIELNPEVFSGFLIPKIQTRSNIEEIYDKEYAHISTRITEVQNSIATIKIVIGIQSYDDNDEKSGIGYTEVWNLLERTRQELLKHPIVGKKFKVKGDIKVSMPEEIFYPYWVGEIITLWEIPEINEEGINFNE